jgi:hypothetical protein
LHVVELGDWVGGFSGTSVWFVITQVVRQFLDLAGVPCCEAERVGSHLPADSLRTIATRDRDTSLYSLAESAFGGVSRVVVKYFSIRICTNFN